MTRLQTIKMIRREMSALNKRIDEKIIKGLSYAYEAKRHKFLKTQLSRLTPQYSWFDRSMGFVSTFLL
jgi:hypothetical protein